MRRLLSTYLEAFLYLLPFFAGIGLFVFYPAINVLTVSFMEDYNLLTSESNGFTIGNYKDVLSDPVFRGALRNTAIYTGTVVPISTCLALLFASLLNRKLQFRTMYQTAYFLPMVTSIMAVGLAWKWMYNFDYGLFNYLRSLFGAAPINWLNDPKYGMAALLLYGIWSILPFTIILLLSGMQSINPQYAVAARVDGAPPWRIFFRITLPLLAPTIGLVLIINLINTSKVFDELFPLFNGKPGMANSLYTVVYYIYDTFYVKWNLGPASAAALILFLIVFVLTLLQLFVQRRWAP